MAAPRLHLANQTWSERPLPALGDEDSTHCRNHIKMSTQTAKIAHSSARNHAANENPPAAGDATSPPDEENGTAAEGTAPASAGHESACVSIFEPHPSASHLALRCCQLCRFSAEPAAVDAAPSRRCRSSMQSGQREEPSSLKIRSARRRSSLGRAPSVAESDESLHLCHRIQCNDAAGDKLRKDLRFFFLDPVQKCRIRRQFPWKFSLQLLKIVVVTVQIVMFGDMRMSHVDFIDQSVSALRHFMLKNWDDGRDVRTYPPNLPPYALFDVDSFYEHLTYATQQYYRLNTSAFGLWKYNATLSTRYHGLQFCVNEFTKIDFDFQNDTYVFDTALKKSCVNITIHNPSDLKKFSMKDFLIENNMVINHTKFVDAILSFGIKCVHLRRNQASNYLPDCFSMAIDIIFDNSKHSGKVLIDLKNSLEYLTCSGNVVYSDVSVGFQVGMALIDISVTLICLLSLILCFRSLLRARMLKQRTMRYFAGAFDIKLSEDEKLMFLNAWYVFILLNDGFLIIGVICKFSIEYKLLGSALFNFTGMLLGLGTLFAWVGILRYLGFFSHYNILILTLKRALPNVLRFMVCAGLVYMGFMFCGWIILGPYHMKRLLDDLAKFVDGGGAKLSLRVTPPYFSRKFSFRDLMTTSECLFALINGDDMFATFTTTSEDNLAVVWFARVYLYIFISLFIYIVLSLFISIIMDAYEVVKDKYHFCPASTFLQDFIQQCDDASLKRPLDNDHCCNFSPAECCGNLMSKFRKHSYVPYSDLDNEEITETSNVENA